MGRTILSNAGFGFLVSTLIEREVMVEDVTDLIKAFIEEMDAARRQAPAGSLDDYLDWVAQELTPFTEHPGRIRLALSSGALMHEHAFLVRTRDSAWVHALIREHLREYRAARDADISACAKVWGDARELIDRAIENTGEVALLQQPIGGEPALDVKAVFRVVGDLIEGSLQPLLRHRLAMRGIENADAFRD